MKRTINQTHLEGLLYQHNLELKTTGEKSKNPGTQYIAGTIDIATDDAHINIVPVHFTYVTALTAKQKPNETFNILKNIIDNVYGTMMKDGEDKAIRVRVDSALGLNEFYTEDKTDNNKEIFVSVKRNEGGFIHVISENDMNADEKARNTFKCDMIITKFKRVEANEEKNIPEKGIIKGCVFNFRNEILPVEFSALTSAAMDYFEGLEPSESNPVFTQVWGKQVSETIITSKVTESAFGEPVVSQSRSTNKDFVITGALPNPYEFDDEGTITVQEFKEAMSKREIYLATLKKNRDEYKASKNKAPVPNAIPKAELFNF